MSSGGPGGTLAGGSAVVTGGGSGIGLACAERLARRGAWVTIVGRTEDKLARAAGDLAGAGAIAIAVADVADEAAITAAVRQAASRAPLRAVVAAAGTGWLAPLPSITLDAWQRVLDTNLTGTFLTLKAAAAPMAAAGGGGFVAISSIAAGRTHRYLAAYAVAKSAVEALVRNAADELGAHGIRVNAVAPGLVPTDLSAGLVHTAAVRDDYLDQMPIRRLGSVDDIAEAVDFLAGPAASWITGACLPVDGGHHLRRGPDYDPLVPQAMRSAWLPS